MTDTAIFYRNKIIHGLYVGVLKPIFFLNDPEKTHDLMTRAGIFLGRISAGRAVTRSFLDYQNGILAQDIFGLSFKNPIGLSAGFDKNAELTDILPSVGFGFAEVGSITGEKCAGNPKPRLWRLPKSKSLAVHYGLKNDGCEAIAARLQKKLAEKLERNFLGKKLDKKSGDQTFGIPIGMSVAMTNARENMTAENAIKDFAKAFRIMEPLADYLTVNISCPNVEGGMPFVVAAKLDRLFDTLDLIPTAKPVFIKLSPDLSRTELDSILDVVHKHRIHGIICANLTKKFDVDKLREIDRGTPEIKGGLSGKAVQNLSDDMLGYIYEKEGRRYILVGCGGVFTAEDAYKKIKLGASLIQMITGMIFEGPQVISEINRGLVELLKKDGFTNISQAIGRGVGAGSTGN
jgi:dihydroorotate dehydrogenase